MSTNVVNKWATVANWRDLLNHRADQIEAEGVSSGEAMDAAILELREVADALDGQREALLLNFHASDPSFDGWIKLPVVRGALTGAWSVAVDDLVAGRATIPPCGLDTVCKEDLGYRIAALAQMVSDIGYADLLRPVRDGDGHVGHYMHASSKMGEAFIPSRNGDNIMFCQFRCRKAHVPPKEVEKRLLQRYGKKQRQGKGAQEHFAVNMLRIIRLGQGIIPLGIEHVQQLVDPLANPLSTALERDILNTKRALGIAHDDELGQKWARRLLYQYYMAYRALTESDTPMWVAPTEDLALLLTNTDAKGVFGRDVQFPSSSVNVLVPPGLFTSEFVGGTTVSSISIGVGSSLNNRVVDTLSYLTETGTIETDLSPMPQIMTYGLSDDEEISLSRLKSSSFEHLSADGPTDDDVFLGVAGRSVNLSEFTALLFNFCVNLMLFITSQSDVTKQKRSLGVVKEKGKGKGRKKRKRPLSEVEEWVVGTEVKLDKSSRETFKKGASSTISYSFIVRGHWRNQAHGPNRSLRKRIWIRPFVKGRDLSKRIMGHTYKDGEVA